MNDVWKGLTSSKHCEKKNRYFEKSILGMAVQLLKTSAVWIQRKDMKISTGGSHVEWHHRSLRSPSRFATSNDGAVEPRKGPYAANMWPSVTCQISYNVSDCHVGQVHATHTRGRDCFRLIVFIGILFKLDLCQRIHLLFSICQMTCTREWDIAALIPIGKIWICLV